MRRAGHATFIISALLALGCTRQTPKQKDQPTSAVTESKPTLSTTPADPKNAVARIDGEVITEAELAEAIKGQLRSAENEYLEKVWQARVQGLEAMINKRLVDKKAALEKLTAEQLVQRDVYAKIEKPSAAEVEALYQRAVAAGQQLPPLDTVRGEIENYLQESKKQELFQSYVEGLRSASKVENLLPPLLLPKVNVSAEGPSKGEPSAPVVIVEFSDFECPYCKKAEPLVKQVLEAYPGKVRFVYREFPLPNHSHAQKASEAALCAEQQGKYWEMHDMIFERAETGMAVDNLKTYARELGLDAAKFDACLDGGATAAKVTASRQAGEDAGVGGTPTFYINGRPTSALPFAEFRKLIDHELAEIAKAGK